MTLLITGDIYDRFITQLNKIERGGYDAECVGGGRIIHEENKITVFGYSQVREDKSLSFLDESLTNLV